MTWCGIIPYQAALGQVKYVADRAGSYWARKPGCCWPCTTDPRLCEMRESSFESGGSGKRCLLVLPVGEVVGCSSGCTGGRVERRALK